MYNIVIVDKLAINKMIPLTKIVLNQKKPNISIEKL